MTKSREIIEVEMTMTNKGGDIHHTYTWVRGGKHTPLKIGTKSFPFGKMAVTWVHMSCRRFGSRRKFPSLAMCDRWIRQFNEEGHTQCKERLTGNRISQREVHGQDLFNLSLYKMVRPKAYLDKVRAYDHNQNPVNPPYLQSQIYRA
jgi:hypothetical protein